MKTLPPFLTDMLAAPPSAGAGVHAWLFSVARNLHPHMPALEIMALLKERTQLWWQLVTAGVLVALLMT